MQPHVVETTLADAEPLGELRRIGKIDASQPRCVLWSQDGESEGHLACSLKCRSIALAALARSKMFTMASCNLFMDGEGGQQDGLYRLLAICRGRDQHPGCCESVYPGKNVKSARGRLDT